MKPVLHEFLSSIFIKYMESSVNKAVAIFYFQDVYLFFEKFTLTYSSLPRRKFTSFSYFSAL